MSALLKGHGSKEFLLAHDTNDSQNFSNQRILVSASSSLSHDLSELATFLGQQLHEISITGSLTATFRMYLWQRCHEPAVAGVSGVLYWRFSTEIHHSICFEWAWSDLISWISQLTLKRVLCMNVYITHTHIIYWYILCIREYAVPAISCEPMWTRKIRTSTHFRFWLQKAPLGYFFTRAALCSRRLHPECSPVEETAARATVQGKWALLSLDITWQFQVVSPFLLAQIRRPNNVHVNGSLL